MKKRIALFAALFLLLCAPAQAETYKQFTETWMIANVLGESSAWVLDRDGQLSRWDYDANAPETLCTLPVPTDDMFMDYRKPYPDLPPDNQAQIDQTVNLLAEDGDTLYGINKFAGRIGVIAEDGVQWQASIDENPFLTPEGWELVVEGSLVQEHKLYVLLNFYDEAPNALWHTRVAQIDLQTGASRLYDAVEAYRICPYREKLLMLCENASGHFLMQFDPATGATETLRTDAVAGEALAYDAAADAIYISTSEGVYCAAAGAPFTQAAGMPAQFVYGSGIITQNRRYAFFGSGIWAMDVSDAGETEQLTVRLLFRDANLQSLFVQAYPDVRLNWQTDAEMTAADVAAAIRAGDTETAVFSVKVDNAFGSLVEKDFAAPMHNADITASVDRMYPALAAPLKNASGEIVAYPWDFSLNTWSVNPTLWDAYFPDAPLPATWKEFFTLMQSFEQSDNLDGDLFLMRWDYEAMLERVLLSFITRQHRRGEAVDFADPTLSDTLDALNQARQCLLDRGIDAYDEGEIFWDSEIVGEHSLFHEGQSASTRSVFLWPEHTLPAFVFTPDDVPAYSAAMRVLLINPNAARKEQAEAFVAQLTNPEYSVMSDYVFHADATTPLSQGKYKLTAETIAQWQAAAAAITISLDDPLQSDAFLTQARMLIARYAAGQLNDALFLSKLNETARMVEQEMP